ncbi:ATPase, activator of (R)-hydroxyglutaryl-CoA dehydratase [Candidatus Desulfosporosinus infrequens]|uniref:ATPase, activator of (R)-hydroxyglutaryl-CoA dehydratase n=1 Tax=Candidatus Desulfosporosinus infrequens TaxID=2043169 RepID=A0A2U3K938_9FIRM|nr:ATPase, activator of (R)-hydroxyglutaryl-CoA dehydratase [Candidatus Desulfosporosinus infrequens]
MVITAGIDVGSTATKAVIFDGTIRSIVIIPTGWNPKEAGRNVFLESLNQAGLQEQDVDRIVGTGYGRVSLSFIDKKVTEITCHAKGAKFLFPQTRTVIDIGGQDSKVIAVAEDGSVADFIMNDKCAAGTGRFLQVMTGILDITLAELGQMASGSEPVSINSMCTVFAESEIIGLLAQEVTKETIASGIVHTIAKKLISLTSRVPCLAEITFSGGVANNPEICTILSSILGVRFNIPQQPQVVGALGAALVGFGNLKEGKDG